MGKINQGILGGFSGKVGTVIGSSWKGIAYMRSVPQSVKNPRTPAQISHRERFKLLVGFLSDVNEFVKEGFGALAVKQTPQNVAFSNNYSVAFTGTGENLRLDYSKLKVSKGDLPGAKTGLLSLSDGKLNVSWTAVMGGMATSSDTAMVLIYNPAKRAMIGDIDGETSRMEGAAGYDVPEDWKGDKLEAYIAFRNVDGMVSDSLYCGSVEVTA